MFIIIPSTATPFISTWGHSEHYRVITAEGDDLLKIIFHYFTERFVLKQIEYPLGIRKSSATYHNSDRHSGINIVGIKQ